MHLSILADGLKLGGWGGGGGGGGGYCRGWGVKTLFENGGLVYEFLLPRENEGRIESNLAETCQTKVRFLSCVHKTKLYFETFTICHQRGRLGLNSDNG
jgi:hypothetical protein